MSNEGASKESPSPRTATQRSALRRNATQRFLILEGGMKITKLSPAQRPATRRLAAHRSATQLNGRSFGTGIPKRSRLRDASCINHAPRRSAPPRHAPQRNSTAGPPGGRHP